MATILHVDMDAFFASVEQLHHPEWRGKPLVVGAGPHERGVVSTCSYEARKFGVRSAMPSRTAYEKCPQAIFVRPDMAAYAAVSRKAFEVFEHFTPYVESVSIDEAFLDISGSIHLYGSARALGEALRGEIRATCGVTCSVGIASNRLLAKLGSEERKPDGLAVMPSDPGEVAALLAPRRVGVIWGVGRKTEETLRRFGLATCRHLQEAPVEKLSRILGSRSAAVSIKELAFGRSDDTVRWQPQEEQSVSREHTFKEDVFDREAVRRKLLELVVEVGRQFRSEKRWARTVRIKLRDTSFATITRQAAFDAPARDDMTFREKALELFDREALHGVRLVGFGVTNIQHQPDAGEPTLFCMPDDERRKKRERLSETLDSLRRQGLLSS